MSETWRLRVTERERRLVEKRAAKEGWQGYSAWMRERLLWACELNLHTPQPQGPAHEGARGAFLTARFAPRDLETLRAFADYHGLDLTAWARALVLTPDERLTRI